MDIGKFLQIIKEGENEKVEFKKDISSDIGEEIVALANAEGGYLLIGVDDSGNIVGCDVKKVKNKLSSFLTSITPPAKIKISKIKINKKEVVVLKVEKSKFLATIGGMAYIRVGTSKRPLSIQEIIALGVENILFPIDSAPTHLKVNSINRDYFKWFLNRRKERGMKKVKNLEEKLQIIKKINGNRRLTLAGALFLCKEPQQYFPHTYVRLIYGDVKERIDGPIWKIVMKLEEKLNEIIPKKEIFVGFERKDEPIFPLRAVREAVINALVHRNYAIYSEVFIELQGLTLKIRNPGGFPPGVTPENPMPVPRNPILYELMYEVGYIEKQGSGIIMMKELCKANNVKLSFNIKPNFTEVILRFISKEKDLLSFLEEPISASKLAKILKISKPTLLKKLKKLERAGVVESIGKGAFVRWVRKNHS
jgi:ATP-dependent DNA helicase RecG